MARRRHAIDPFNNFDTDTTPKQRIRVRWPRHATEFALMLDILAARYVLQAEGTRGGVDDALSDRLLIKLLDHSEIPEPAVSGEAPELITSSEPDCCWDLELFRLASRGPILWTDAFRDFLERVIRDREQALAQMAARPMRDAGRKIAEALDLPEVCGELLPWLAVLRRYDQTVSVTGSGLCGRALQAVTGLDGRAMQAAVGRGSTVRRVGLMPPGDQITGDDVRNEPLSSLLERLALIGDGWQGIDPVEALLRQLPAGELDPADYDHLPVPLDLVLKLLAQPIAGAPAPNILLHGPPGTGKSQLARLIAERSGRRGYEVPVLDGDESPLGGTARMIALRLCQRVIGGQPESALLVFDEAEDLFPNPMFSPRDSSALRKGWINQMLENMRVPTIWITNAVSQIDPAFLRRFELVVEVAPPTRKARERLLDKLLPKELVSAGWRGELAGHDDLSPDELKRVVRVGELLADAPGGEREAQLRQVFSQVRHAQGRPLAPKRPPLPGHYRPDLVNATIDLDRTAQKLGEIRQGRLCLYGPPGTGKSAWAQYLAERLGVPMLQKRASDLLSKWVGENEKNIAAAFAEAAREGALLLIDEADSLLQDRRKAHRSWEVSQVNELLTQIEVYDGLLVICTNLYEDLDAAALRRFDIRAEFRYLRSEQAAALLGECVDRHGIPSDARTLAEAEQRLMRLDRLTPGDFQTVLRRGRLSPHADVVDFVAGLAEEQDAKRDHRSRPIGFHRVA